jgi:myo-inositol-1(or 4)-monophosphatase
MNKLHPIFENHNHTRHFGANALEMAMFARGLMDIFIDLRKKNRIKDNAAG